MLYLFLRHKYYYFININLDFGAYRNKDNIMKLNKYRNSVQVHIGISWKYEIKIERVGEHTISNNLVELMKKRIEKFQKIMKGYQNLCNIEEFKVYRYQVCT